MDVATPLLVAEAARFARVSETTIRSWFDEGKLLGFRTSTGLRLIDRRALELLVLSRATVAKKGR